MQKILIEFSYDINGKKFLIQFEPGYPIADAKEAVFLFTKDLAAIQDQQKAAQEEQEKLKQEQEAKKVEDKKVEDQKVEPIKQE